ncbi:hypothetical protein DZ894_07570 [Pseudomonas aeruginosa]|uniref:hypothetical protein n=1 Tax=Pseudomonas aeruginosa TaxID=287 RepID=UPI000E36037B|nr:hypothetical protein [Pseudomonas aeruginosa]AXR27531.1 hypothetical protein DZ894_07570 [Pseudomonas aeruginosa]
MTESKICTCPSGDGSLRWPCPAHPADQAGGDERAAFELFVRKHCGMPAHIAVNWDAKFTNDAWEGWKARAALAQPSPVRSSLLINGYQLRAALDFIAPDGTAEQLESEACIEWRQQDADFLEAGLYAFCAEYPEEGGVLLDEEPTTAQPSPLQSEQAEAERPEVVAYRTIGRHTKHQHPHYALNYYKQNAEDQAAHWRERGCEVSEDELMTVAQHERIVGALRAEIAEWQEAAGRSRSDVVAYIAERAKLLEERDAALAEVERLRESKGDPVGSLEKCMKVMYERDEHAKRLEAALARVAELEKELAMARDAAAKGDAARQQCGGMEMEIEELRAELAELRSRAVVVPDAANDRRKSAHYCRGWNACLDELARLNGLTVSEGLVQGMATFAREIICGALEGGSFDGADIQESAERHGLIAKQVMNEPCRGPEEYCACAWSTSFPAECYRVTPELRALLSEQAGEEP